ncbi:DGLA lipase, partial [Atractosteus spatula]|nr:DGLA lipase [Atractosteus spatula]
MPGMVVFRRRWSVGSDDLVLPALFLFLLHSAWLVVLSVVLFGLPYGSDSSCSVTLVDHGRGYVGILVSCLICESAIMWLSMRGTILYTEPREAVQYVLYIRLAILLVELLYAVVGIAWLVQYYQPCSDFTAKNVTLGIVACNWLVILSVCITMMCTFDPTGRTFVKLKATRRRQRNLTTYTLRHRLEEGQASSWSRRLKFFMCCTRAQDSQSDAYSEIASLFAEFFRDLDIVPSDIIAGLVLLRQRQRAKRSATLDQVGRGEERRRAGGLRAVSSNPSLSQMEMTMYRQVCYYMLFAMAAYGWPMYLMRTPACGLCRLASSCSCLSLSPSRFSQSVTVEEDNCCGCNVLAIRRHFLDQDLKEVDIIYTSCHDAVYETPFFVAVDHGKKKVVISIRGTLSPKDALTDLAGDAERLPVERQHGIWLGHKGMVYSAEYIKKKLETEMILSQAFGRDLVRGTKHYGLVVVGHSLGAGTAAILSFLLRPQYPTLHCYSYSPPGGLLSEDAMEYSKEFVTSVVLGKDLVPRIGLSQLEGFRRHLLEVLQKSNKPKWRIIMGGTKCIPKSELPNDDDPTVTSVPSSGQWLHPSDLSIALSASTPLYPPGRIIHVVHNHPPESWPGLSLTRVLWYWSQCDQSCSMYVYKQAYKVCSESLSRCVQTGSAVTVCPVCFLTLSLSLSLQVLENYNKGKTALLSAAKIMVSPTEVDLNPEMTFLGPPNLSEPSSPQQHRRNSSVRSQSLPQLRTPVPPSAPYPCPSLSSVSQSLPQLRVPVPPAAPCPSPSRSSVPLSLPQLRVPVPPSAPCPSPSRSSVTGVLARGRAVEDRRALTGLPSVYSPRGSPPHRHGAAEGRGQRGSWAGGADQAGVSLSLPLPLPNGGPPSQAVLEFAQFIDALFCLDRSSPPLELSDEEPESGRGSEPPGDRRLLTRATLEPNLVPKPPRTFAGSAGPSSGISLSPSFPLSSSGELNDLSPSDSLAAPPERPLSSAV